LNPDAVNPDVVNPPRDGGPEVVVAGAADFPRTAALRIAAALEAALARESTASLAFPGGPQVKLVYPALAELALPWERVDFFFADERGVPSVHPASSYFPAADVLFSRPRIGLENVARIEAERPDLEAVAAEYEARLPERLDVLVLELGLDGHVAGLFPRSAALAERERRVLAVEAPQKPRRRITLGPRVIGEARDLVVLATGRDRAELVRRALDEPGAVEELPARLALRGTWVIDSAAAALARAAC
jgi:6-phosphogluconolactonase